MLGFFAYLGGCFAVAGLMTVAFALVRPIRDRDEMRSWRVLLFCFVLVALAPYGWAEAMTRIYGKGMEEPLQGVMSELKVVDGLKYYKVLLVRGDTARVVAVGEDRESWGYRDQAIVAVSLEKDGGAWSAKSYTVVNSVKRNADSYTLPPYW